jgi:hypothetical protein
VSEHDQREEVTDVVVLGVVLIVIGVAFLLLGLAGAARDVFQKTHPQSGDRALLPAFDPEKWATLVKALNETIKLAGAWFAMVLVGGILVGAGAYLLNA